MTADESQSLRGRKWQPHPRPEWVARLNEEGRILDAPGIVPLDEDSLVREARRNTGLHELGDDGWMEHFVALLRAIREEADLNFMGRILTRSDMLMHLQARLQIQDYYRRYPEIDEQTIEEPVMLLGHGRTGTTILHEVLSCDPQFRVVKRWEAMFPCPPPEPETYFSDPRIQKAHDLITIFDRITPEWQTMHKFGGDLPVEDAEFLYASFLSNVYLFAYHIPSYAEYLARQDPLETIRWHERFLKLLQWKYRKDHWLLKNPIWIGLIPEILKVYPDAKILLTHRDPVVVSDSFVNVMGTIYWWRTDDPWKGLAMVDDLIIPESRAQQQEMLIDWMEDGTLRPGYVSNVLHRDFMSDPLGTVRSIYDDLRLSLAEEDVQKMSVYLDSKPKGKYGQFRYDTPDSDQLRREREIFRRYQDYFSVPDEV